MGWHKRSRIGIVADVVLELVAQAQLLFNAQELCTPSRCQSAGVLRSATTRSCTPAPMVRPSRGHRRPCVTTPPAIPGAEQGPATPVSLLTPWLQVTLIQQLQRSSSAVRTVNVWTVVLHVADCHSCLCRAL